MIHPEFDKALREKKEEKKEARKRLIWHIAVYVLLIMAVAWALS